MKLWELTLDEMPQEVYLIQAETKKEALEKWNASRVASGDAEEGWEPDDSEHSLQLSEVRFDEHGVANTGQPQR